MQRSDKTVFREPLKKCFLSFILLFLCLARLQGTGFFYESSSKKFNFSILLMRVHMPLPVQKKMSTSIGTLHFIGIGGIGMSGIAEILHHLGYKVQGSDLAENANSNRLKAMGLTVFIGQDAKNIEGAAVVIKSSAVKDSNPEIIAARENRIPVIKRAEMLAELMRLKTAIAIAGTHGKTTTTSLVAALFEAAKLAPTVINGGILNNHGTNAYLGSGDFLIAEADESDATFIKIPSTIAVITNIDPEHLDYYQSFDVLRAAFRTFIENLPFYGFAVLCKDHPEVAHLIATVIDRRIISYGLQPGADIVATNIREDISGSTFDVEISDTIVGGKRQLIDVYLPMPGIHNIQNALAAIAIALELAFDEEIIINGFRAFKGVKRRFTTTGEVDGITVIDDYGHHPVEIMASLRTAKSVATKKGGKVIAVLQPHRYTRLHDLFSEFTHCLNDADTAFIADVYAAGESPLAGASRDVLVAAIRQSRPDADIRILDNPLRLAALVSAVAEPNDLVICLGAGNITAWAATLPEEIRTLRQAEAAALTLDTGTR